MKLRELPPDPFFNARWSGDPVGYSVEQVREIQLEAARDALEAAAAYVTNNYQDHTSVASLCSSIRAIQLEQP